jgi:hypothetical protein
MSTGGGNPAGRVWLRYRRADGEFADTTLERVVVDDVVAGLPVREFRWYKGRRHYSGWYWSSTMGEVPRTFRTVHPIGWAVWKGEIVVPT